MRVRLLGSAIAVLICVSACTSGSDPDPSSPKPIDAVATIDPAKAQVLKLGEDLEIVAKLPSKMGKQDAYFRGFTSDGKLLGSVSLPEKPRNDGIVGGGLTSQSYAVLYDLETKKFTVLDSRKRERNPQIPSIVSSADYVVWLETPDTTIGSSTIAIYSYDRRSKKVTQLYSANGRGGRDVGGEDLVVADDRVYFSRWACCREKDRGDAAVYSVPVDGSAPAKVLVEGGQFVGLDGDSLTYDVKDVRFSRDLRTGETAPVPVPASQHAKDPGFCGAEFTELFETLCIGEPVTGDADQVDLADPILTITETSGRKTRFKPFPSDSLNYPVPGNVTDVGPWIGVRMTSDGGADRMFLVDLESHAMKAFPKDTSFGEMNHDGTQVLLSKTFDAKRWPKFVVRIPQKD